MEEKSKALKMGQPKKDPLDIINADHKDVIWIAYPDIGPGKLIRFFCSGGKVIIYISLSMGIRFLKKPWDNRTIYLKFHNNWLDDERLSLIREKTQRDLKLQAYYWDHPIPGEFIND